MDKQRILEYCSDWTDGERAYLKRWFKTVISYGDERIINILKDNRSICSLYYIQDGVGMSRQTYTRISRGVKVLLSYFDIKTSIPNRESVLNAQPITYLYKNLESLIERIDFVGNKEMPNYDPSKDLLSIKAIAILGWNGLSLTEIASIKNDTLCKIEEKCFVSDKKIELELPYYRILESLSKSTSYRTFPAGKTYFYQGNEHLLFRNAVDDGLINDRTLKNQLVGFNSVFEKTCKCTIKFIQLKKNAMFSNVPENYTDERIVGMFKKKPYEYTHRAATDLLKEYCYWKKATK